MSSFLLIGIGGAIGSIGRFVVGGWVQRSVGAGFPYGTLAVNALGSFLLMVIMHAASAKGLVSPDARLFLTTGVMGGFTTYSTFNYETIKLIETGSLVLGAANVVLTVLTCLFAGLAGTAAARFIIGS